MAKQFKHKVGRGSLFECTKKKSEVRFHGDIRVSKRKTVRVLVYDNDSENPMAPKYNVQVIDG